MGGYGASWFPFELLLGLTVAALVGFVLVAMSDEEMKYKLAVVAAIGGSAMLVAVSERWVVCVMLWVLIHPLSIEKVFTPMRPRLPNSPIA